MTVAVAKAVERGREGRICASTGNTSASAAAYAAQGRGSAPSCSSRNGKIAPGKLAAGAWSTAPRWSGTRQLRRLPSGSSRALADSYPVALVNSVNPFRLRARRRRRSRSSTAWAMPPTTTCMPVGNAGNISAYWTGYERVRSGRRTAPSTAASCSASRPRARRRWCSAAPSRTRRPRRPRSASATRPRGSSPSAAAAESGGRFRALTDEQILSAQALLARNDGVFVEPASAAGVAGLLADLEAGETFAGATTVITVTGHGLKDTATALEFFGELPEIIIDADLEAAAAAAGLA